MEKLSGAYQYRASRLPKDHSPRAAIYPIIASVEKIAASLRYRAILGLIIVLSILSICAQPGRAALTSATVESAPTVRLPGHVLPALAKATAIRPGDENAEAANGRQLLTLTIVLKRDDQLAFDRYLRDVYDSHSPRFHRFLNQRELARKFGPSRKVYAGVRDYLRAKGFMLVASSANRLTLTLRGTRAQAEHAFALHIGDYRIRDRRFYANDRDPALPGNLASRVAAVIGLSNFAQPRHSRQFLIAALCGAASRLLYLAAEEPPLVLPASALGVYCVEAVIVSSLFPDSSDSEVKLDAGRNVAWPSGARMNGSKALLGAPSGLFGTTGAGQTIGLLEFDTFKSTDVADYLGLLAAAAIPEGKIGNVSEIPVNGGVASPGTGEPEVLLDIDDVISVAPGAKIAVYDAPFAGPGASFQAVFNAMIDGGVSIISNSWAYCEDETSLADASSIDSILATAAASGISVFNGSGDNGSTCLDGSPNTVAVPADSPHATAVGGTSLKVAPGFTYQSETWWNGSAASPPTGAGGFGLSKFFVRPTYQDGLNIDTARSVPDVAINADPASGIVICQADAGGCPTGLINGGTSLAAPTWAALTALLNQAQGSNLGALNPLIYPLAKTSAFHSPASMGSDFNHVGLGSPNLNQLHLLLSGMTAGPPSAAKSPVTAFLPAASFSSTPPGIPADGTSTAAIVVTLIDENGNAVSGKTVTLAANAGSHAIISPASGVSTIDNGAVTFMVPDTTPETVIFTATDTTDGVALKQTKVGFVTPPAASAGLDAFPASVTADGVSTTDITVTLKDSLGRPSPGKLVSISQGSGQSLITGPIPSVTNASGQVEFTAVDQVAETVTYSAIDVTDGNLPFPTTGT